MRKKTLLCHIPLNNGTWRCLVFPNFHVTLSRKHLPTCFPRNQLQRNGKWKFIKLDHGFPFKKTSEFIKPHHNLVKATVPPCTPQTASRTPGPCNWSKKGFSKITWHVAHWQRDIDGILSTGIAMERKTRHLEGCYVWDTYGLWDINVHIDKHLIISMSCKGMH